MADRADRSAVIDEVLEALRHRLEAELPGNDATLDEIEGAVTRLEQGFRRELRARIFPEEGAFLPDWLSEVDQKLQRLLELPENWDSYGACRVKPEIVQAVQAVLPQIAPPGLPAPSIVPTVRGGVQLEWHARGVDLEVEANSPDLLQVLYDDQGESTELELGVEKSDLDRLRDLTARVGHLNERPSCASSRP